MTAVESRLRLEPTALDVRRVGDWLRSATGHLDEQRAEALLSRAELAVHEACMNVIDHANLPDGAVIDLRLALEPDRLTVWVMDPGDEFDMSGVAAPPEGTLQERGYGVKIIRALVSELTYRRTAEGNELTLRIDEGDDDGRR